MVTSTDIVSGFRRVLVSATLASGWGDNLMAKGDHLVTRLYGPLTHHGIDVGDGTVVHWSSGLTSDESLRDAKKRKVASAIRRTTLAYFRGENEVRIREYQDALDADVVVQRALERVGESGYSLLFNNCEHFATWCKTDEHRSAQVDLAVAVGKASVAGGSQIASSAPVVTRIATEKLSRAAGGLGTIVRSPMFQAAGFIASMTLPGAVSVAGLHAVLADDQDLCESERSARAAGRASGTAGAFLSTAGAIGTVAAMGTPGLSAIGISTGLAALGGGSIACGIAAAAALPVVATFGVGLAIYKIHRPLSVKWPEKRLSFAARGMRSRW